MKTRKMKTRYVMVMAVLFILSVSATTHAEIPIVWQADVYHPNQEGISRIKLTPDNENIMVFGSSNSHGSPIIVDKFNSSNGSLIWSKSLSKSGKRLVYGWVDSADNIYFMSVWNGYTLWKYDPELITELGSYTGPTSFEYVQNIITDELNNIYATGFFGSGSGQGSTLVKLDSNCNLIWTQKYTATSGKDDYNEGLALDSNKNVFRGGSDNQVVDARHGRLLGHNANDGAVFLDVPVDETNSSIYGIIIDDNEKIIIGYTYNLLKPDNSRTTQERTVIQKFDQSGSSLWKYTFPDVGMYMLNNNCVVKRNDNSFCVAYNLTKEGATYPGIAEFDIDGNLVWRDTLNEPGWYIAGIDTGGNEDYIYVSLVKESDRGQGQILCLASEPPVPDIEVSPLSHDFGNVELGTSTTLVATISNVGTGDLTVNGIALETDFAITSVPSAAIVVGPSETKDVEITYTPTLLGYNSAVLKISSDDPDEPVVEVILSAVGIITPPPPSEQIANILFFFDTSVADTTLEGDGPGKSAANRLNALRNMIKAASDLIHEELYAEACQQLIDVSTRMDGQHNPPDFVKGESVEELETMVQSLITSLGC